MPRPEAHTAPDERPCDLCGSSLFLPLLAVAPGRALASGQRIVEGAQLGKELCGCCALARNTEPDDPARLLDYYLHEYDYNTKYGDGQDEHFFFEKGAPVPRSRMLHDWLLRLAPDEFATPGARILEIGCGQGNLLARVRDASPKAVLQGTELNLSAAALAAAKGLNVTAQDTSALPPASFDIVYSVGVIEHVTSPRAFLAEARRLLAPGGICLTSQPCLDVDTPDIFFIDHLHHFSMQNLTAYALATGFSNERAELGYRSIPAFSMLRLRKTDNPHPLASPQPTSSPEDLRTRVDRYLRAFRRVDEQLARDGGRRIAVFGLSTMLALLRAYTRLGAPGAISCGVDDAWERNQGGFPFPVKALESLRPKDADIVYLCLHPQYIPPLLPRLERQGLHYFNCFAEFAG